MRWLAVPTWFLVACTPASPRVEPEAAPAEASAPIAVPVDPGPVIASEPAPIVAPTPEPEPEPAPAPVAVSPRHAAKLQIAFPRADLGWTVDIIDLDAEIMAAAIAAGEGIDDGDDEPDMLAPDSPAIPRGWKVGDTWSLVTRDGVLRRQVSGFMVSGGASESHFEVVLGGVKTPATLPVLAIRGRDVAEELRFTAPPKRDVALLGDDPVAAVRAAIVRSVDAEGRSLFERARIGTRHLAIYDGRFPGGRTQIIVLDAPLPRIDSEADLSRASALLMRRDDGTLEFVTRAGVDGTLRLRAIVDVDGDGVDEVFYEDAYYEGSYEVVLQWQDGKPRTRTLAGDGA
jgi:hypothetical protein